MWSSVRLFSSGVALGVVAMVISPVLRRWGSPRPNQVLSSVLPKIRADSEVSPGIACMAIESSTSSECPSLLPCCVQCGDNYMYSKVRDAVGSALKPGLFRAYMYDGGVRWNGVHWGGVKLSGVKQSIRHLITFHPCKCSSSHNLTSPPPLPPSLPQISSTYCSRYMERCQVLW